MLRVSMLKTPEAIGMPASRGLLRVRNGSVKPLSDREEALFGPRPLPEQPARPRKAHRWKQRAIDASAFATLGILAPGVAHALPANAAIVQQEQKAPIIALDSAVQIQVHLRQDRLVLNQDSVRKVSPSALPDRAKITQIITVHSGDNGWKLAKREVKAAGLTADTPMINAFDHLLNGQARDGVSEVKPKEQIVAFSAPVNEALGTLLETPLPQDTPAPIKEVKAELEQTNHYPAGTTFEQTEAEDQELVTHAESLITEAEKPSSQVGKELRELGILTAMIGPAGPSSPSPGSETSPPASIATPGPAQTPPSEEKIQKEIGQVAREAGKAGYIKGLENAGEGALAVGILAAGALLYTRRRRRRKEKTKQLKEAERLQQERRLRDLIDNTRYHAALLVQAQDQGRIRVMSTNRQYLEEEVNAQINGFEHFRPTELTDAQKWALTAVKRRLYNVQRDKNIFGHDGEKELISTTHKTDEAILMIIANPSAMLQEKIDLLTDPKTLLLDPYIRNEANEQAIDKLLHLAGIIITKREPEQPVTPPTQIPKLVASAAPSPPAAATARPVTTFTKAASNPANAPDASRLRFLHRGWYKEQLKRLRGGEKKKKKT